MKLFANRPPDVAGSGYSVIDNALTVAGDIDTSGTIRIDGRVEGTLHRADTLIIGAGGVVNGNIEAREVVIGGELKGNLVATVRVEIQTSATVCGDIRAAAVQLIEGGSVHGHISIQPVDPGVPQVPVNRRLSLTPSIGNRIIAQG